ncbi:signal peptide peptidase SppA [Gracilibacillus oryzae]|uniref:Signal peptide peptidase SppA n=1 Tax=Gracilibacillus oryzae TaxID=1672701 RepID=A0A7C8KS75_9BACI|nr:signal peptide peptidase SppA [Gracilibacillus oryzae]KAB8127484.1 signal peptide peptidase SppA [Gracilibacillus oryzae]
MNMKRWIALVVAAALFFISMGFQFMSSILSANMNEAFNFADLDQEFSEKVVEEGSPASKIAVLHLNGVIQNTTPSSLLNTSSYNHQRFLDMLEHAGEDNSVKGIVLHVNTPGGGVVESAEIHDKINEIKEETNKPIYVSMGNTAASGGYYVSAPADKIVAHKATLTGSIGVIMENINFTQLAEELGIDFNTIKSGEHKDILSSYREMTEEERQILQSMIDDMYNDFVDVIVEGRGLSEERVRELGDGRIYTGSQELEVELVDAIGSLDDTIAMIKEEHDLASSRVVEYENGMPFGQFFGAQIQNMFGNNTDFTGIKELLQQGNAPRAMYLYSR